MVSRVLIAVNVRIYWSPLKLFARALSSLSSGRSHMLTALIKPIYFHHKFYRYMPHGSFL